MSRTIIAALILALLATSPAYAKSPEDARKELEKLNIPYTSAEFMERAEQGDAAAVKLFLDAGMDPEAKKYGATALIMAAYFGHTDIAETLLAKGADVNAKSSQGVTALIQAAQQGHTETAKALLAKGADVNAKSNDGTTALIQAAQNGHTDIVKTLLAKGADINAKTTDGRTALLVAEKNGHTDIVEVFSAYAGSPEDARKEPEKLNIQSTSAKNQELLNKAVGEMVLIPAGEFMMGSPSGEGDDDEHPQHKVYVDAFYMDKYEVTVGDYKAFVRATGHRSLPDWVSEYSPSDKHPVVGVSWEDATAYAKWVGKRLPTEAEWEYVCRAGTGTKYGFGNSESLLGDYAWYISNSGWSSHPVGQKKPNAWGLYDMHGNVSEWCSDWYEKDYYSKSPSKNPTGPTNGRSRVVRGGPWAGYASALLSAGRFYFKPGDGYSSFGFRCARDE